MKAVLRARLLWVAATDSTFERMQQHGRTVLSGRCIHCRKRHQLRLDGLPLSAASLEHIVPRTHGGTHEAHNFAIACRACNAAKGRRLDCRRSDDPDLQHVIDLLRARRRERWRSAPLDWGLAEPPPDWISPRPASPQRRSR